MRLDVTAWESKYETFRRSTGIDQLITEKNTLKSDLTTAKSKLSRVNIDHENLKDKYEELKIKLAIKLQKPATADASAQCDVQLTGATFVQQMNLDHANQRAEKYKKAYLEISTNLNQLKAAYEQLKSQQKSSTTAGNTAEYGQLKVQYEKIKSDHEKCVQKHLEAAEFLDKFKVKYEATKGICNSRLELIHEYKQKIANFEHSEQNLKVELETIKSELKKVTKSNDKLATASKIQYEQMKKDYDEQVKKLRDTSDMLDEMKSKYIAMKDLCVSRYDRLSKHEENEKNFKSEILTLKMQYKDVKHEADLLKRKYETAKVMLENRRQEILRLSDESNNENVPINK